MKLPRRLWLELSAYFVIFLMFLLTLLSSFNAEPLLLTLDGLGLPQGSWTNSCQTGINTSLTEISGNEVLSFGGCLYTTGAAINISQLMNLSNTTILLYGGNVYTTTSFSIQFPANVSPGMSRLHITIMSMSFLSQLKIIGSLPPQSSLSISNNTFSSSLTYAISIWGLIVVGDSSSLSQGSSLVIENNSATNMPTSNETVAFVWLRYTNLQLGANSNISISGNKLHDVALTNAKLYVVYWSPLAATNNVKLTIADSSEVFLQRNAMATVTSFSAAVVFIFSEADISLVVSDRSRLSISNNEALDISCNEGVSVVGIYSRRSVIVTATKESVVSFGHNVVVVDGAFSKDISAFYLVADSSLYLIASLTSSMAFDGNTVTGSLDGYELPNMAVIQAVYLKASQFLTILVSSSSSVSALQNLVSNATDNSHTYSVRWQASSVVNITAIHGSLLTINNNTVRDVSRVGSIVSTSISSSLLSISLIDKSYFGLCYNMVTNAVAIGNASAVRLTGEQQVNFILSASSNVSMNSNLLLNTLADSQIACVWVLGSGTGLLFDVSAASSWNVVANTIRSSSATHGDVSALNCSATSINIILKNSVANLTNNAIESSSGYSLRTVWWNAASMLVAQLSRSTLCVKNNAILGSSYSLNISCAVMWRSESSSRIAISSASKLTVFGNAIFNTASTTLLSTVLLSTLQLNVSNSSTATFSGNNAKNSTGVIVYAILLSFGQLHVANDAYMSLNDNYFSNISASDSVTVVSLKAIAGGAMNMGIDNRSMLCMSRNAMTYVAASRLVNVLIDVSGSTSNFLNVSSGSSIIISSNSIVSSSGLPSTGGLNMSVVVVNYFTFTVSNSYISISNLTVADVSQATTLVGYGIYGGALSLSASSMTISGISIQGNLATTAIRACYFSVVSLTATNSLLVFSRTEAAMTGNGETNTSIAFVTILSNSVVLEEVASLVIRDNRQTLSTVADISLIRITVSIGANCSISVTNNSLDTIYSGDNAQAILSLVVKFLSSRVNSVSSVTISGNNISLTGRFLSSEIIKIMLYPSAWFILVTGNIINVASIGLFCSAALSITNEQSEKSQLTVTRNEIAVTAVSESGNGAEGCMLLKVPAVTDLTSIDIRDNEFLIVNCSTLSTFITIPNIQGSGSLSVIGNRFESIPSDSVIVGIGSQSLSGSLLIDKNFILLPATASLLLVQYTNLVAFGDSEQFDIEACGNRLNGNLIVRPDWYMNDPLDNVYPCSRTMSPNQTLTASTSKSPSISNTSSSTQSRSNNITSKSSTNTVSLSRPTESLSLMSPTHSASRLYSVTSTISTALPTEDEVVFIPVGVPAPTTAILTVTASALGGVTTAVDAQTIAVISMVSCATKGGKRSSKDKDKNEMRSISIVTLDSTCEGLLLGNIIAVIAAAFFTAVMVAVAKIILNNRFIAQKRLRSVAASDAFYAPIVQPTLVNASAMVRAPQLLVMICVYMMNSFAVCGLRLARDDDAASVGTKLGGAVAFIFPLVLAFGFPLVTYLFGTRQLLFVQYTWKPKVVSLLGPSIFQSWALDPSIESDKMFGGVFGAYRRLQPQWALVSQVSFISSLPAMLATTSSGSCGPLFIISSAMYFMGSVTVLVFRPRRVFLVDLLHAITLFVNGLIVAAAVWLVDHPPIHGAAESNFLEHLGTAITVLSVIRVIHSAASIVVNVLISREVLGGVEYVLPKRKEALLSDFDDDLDVLLSLPDDQHSSPLEIERLNSVDRNIQTSSAWTGKTKSHAQSNSILPKILSQYLLISEMSFTGKWWPMPTRVDRPPHRAPPTAVLGDIIDDILGDPSWPHAALLTHVESTSLHSGQSLEIKELPQQLEPERPLVSILNANSYLRSITNEDSIADESLFLSEDEKFRRQIARECVQRQIFETHISDKSKK